MRVLALDLSTNTGWALLEGEMGQIPRIIETGTVANDQPVSAFGEFPWNTYDAALSIASRVSQEIDHLAHQPDSTWKPRGLADVIVIEQTNKPGRFGNRYSQKLLEFIHCLLLGMLKDRVRYPNINVVYVNTSDWRKIVGANLTKADKALNVKVRKLKKAGDKEALKKLGVRGKIGKKHVAVRYVNQTFGLNLKMKDHDVADAICQGVAFFLGVKHCDGK